MEKMTMEATHTSGTVVMMSSFRVATTASRKRWIIFCYFYLIYLIFCAFHGVGNWLFGVSFSSRTQYVAIYHGQLLSSNIAYFFKLVQTCSNYQLGIWILVWKKEGKWMTGLDMDYVWMAGVDHGAFWLVNLGVSIWICWPSDILKTVNLGVSIWTCGPWGILKTK